MPTSPRLPRRRWWRRALAGRYAAAAPRLLAQIDGEYGRLVADPPDWVQPNRALHFHVRQSIAPNLAAYLVLTRELGEKDRALRAVRELVEAQMTPILLSLRAFDRLRPSFRMVRFVNRQLVPRFFPAPGFAISWVTDRDDQLRFDITGCHYLRVLQHYGAPELTSVFCYGDEVAYARMPRMLTFERTGTLAGGAARCDFVLRPATRPATAGQASSTAATASSSTLAPNGSSATATQVRTGNGSESRPT